MCRSCTGINIGEGFFQIVGEQGHTFGYLGRLDSGHIVNFLSFCATEGCTQKLLFFVYFIIRQQGVFGFN